MVRRSFYKERSLRSNVWWYFSFFLPLGETKDLNYSSVLFRVKFVLLFFKERDFMLATRVYSL